jgi:hypothetical protein
VNQAPQVEACGAFFMAVAEGLVTTETNPDHAARSTQRHACVHACMHDCTRPALSMVNGNETMKACIPTH